ncbi:hypothetical protein OE88DRAFT_1740467 [Heliocybe sulcata]|uniref:Uncharacterized protein n=1 Tax=Heliocybe sulcata TaxID=5364 RepID=A0A5C3MV12_9AGAM|nr:hypothetical protein OE88DRAFT_1740467 [Heliocybe sulcata]
MSTTQCSISESGSAIMHPEPACALTSPAKLVQVQSQSTTAGTLVTVSNSIEGGTSKNRSGLQGSPCVPQASIPDLPRRSPVAWKLAVKQWEEPDPVTGKALKDWDESWFKGKMREVTQQKRTTQCLIAEEFARCGRDEAAFLAAYPAATLGIKALCDAIDHEHTLRGERISQSSKNRMV